MSKKVPAHFREIIEDHRNRIARLSQRRGVETMKKMYNEAQADVTKKLKQVGHLKDRFTGHQLNHVAAQIRIGQTIVMQKLAGEMGDVSHEAQTDSLRSLISEVTKLERKQTGKIIELPIDEASRFRGIITGRRESLLRAHQESFSNYGSRLVTKMEDELSLSLVEGETTGDAIERVAETADLEWYQAERIVRTETMGAFNATRFDGLKEAAEELGDLMMRWVEYVDDDTYEPLDDRVGDDSIAMHGQVVTVGGRFRFPPTMPDGSASPDQFAGESWFFPPNRPNDRASLSPWRAHWGIPAWRLDDGERVYL